MIDFLSELPLWALALVLNAWLMGFALVGLWFMHRWGLPWLGLRYEDAGFSSAAISSAMLLYGLIAALTAVGVWQKYAEVESTVSAEATAIAGLWRDLDGLPEPLSQQTHDLLRGYTEYVIQEAWPLQRIGQVPSGGVDWMDRLERPLLSYEPQTEGKKIVLAETLHAFNHLMEERRQRLDAVQTSLPRVFWWVLLPGAMVSIGLFLFFHIGNVRLHAILLVALAGFQALLLLVIIALARPFSGGMMIGPDSYVLIHEQLMKK